MDIATLIIVGSIVAGVAGFATIWRLAGHIERTQPASAASGTPRVLRIVAVADLIVLPILGYVASRLVA